MSWTDQQSIRVINYLKDKYEIKTLVETGTFKGVNAKLHAKTFNLVMTCEKHNAYFEEAKESLKHLKNVIAINQNSPEFVKSLLSKKYIFYLDAHFYDPNMPNGKGKFVVLKELDNMRKFKNSVIIIHDFNNGLGHITYDGISLDFELVRSRLKMINKNFYFYTNTLDSCDIVKPTAKSIREARLDVDYNTLDNINYAWTWPRLTYRGFLYCLPTKLSQDEMDKLGLREWN